MICLMHSLQLQDNPLLFALMIMRLLGANEDFRISVYDYDAGIWVTCLYVRLLFLNYTEQQIKIQGVNSCLF